MNEQEMDDVAAPLRGDGKANYKRPSCTKLLCRGMGSCPPIAVMVVGIILLIFGVLAAITGPSCSCKRAIPKFQEVQNTTQEFKCAQCSWLWLECKVNGRVQSCSRGCVLNAIENNNQTSTDDICLPQTGQFSSQYDYNTISPIQIIGTAVGGAGIILFPIALCVAYNRGKHYLL